MDAVVHNDTGFTLTLSPTSEVATRTNSVTLAPNGVGRVAGGGAGALYSVVSVERPYKVFTSYMKVQAAITLWRPGSEPSDEEAHWARAHHDDARVEATGVWFLARRANAPSSAVDVRQQRSGDITVTTSFNDATRTLTSVIQYNPIASDTWVAALGVAAALLTVFLVVLAFLFRRRALAAAPTLPPPRFPVPARHVHHAVQLP